MKITLTPADMLKGEPHKEGWVKATVTEAIASPNKAQDGINYIATFLIEDDPDKRTIDKIFSSKGIGFMKPFLAALAGKTIQQFIEEKKATGVEFEFDQVKGGKLHIKIGSRLYDGRPVSEIQDFAPYNATVPF
jgi:hypothetical protein